jgi:hypothetical protein
MSSFTRLAYEKGIVIVKCKGCGAQVVIKQNKKCVGERKVGWSYSKVQTKSKIKFVFSMRVLPQKKTTKNSCHKKNSWQHPHRRQIYLHIING